jgi:crotonobetainyl-CoA:carnitine CoA-transferase CaiB-like acyl-CoA transferase
MVLSDGNYKALGLPIKFSRTPGSLRSKPKPLGQDTRAVLRGAGLREEEINAVIAQRIAIESDSPETV